jgi:HK97 family phage major capsid protein
VKEQINKLKEQRFGLVNEIRDLVTLAESEERDLSGEESEKLAKLEKDADSLEQRAGRLEKLAGLEPEPRRQLNDDPDHDDEPKIANTLAEFNEQRAGVLPQDQDDYKQAFFRMVTARSLGELSGEEQRVLSKASAGAGANLVPTDFQRTLIDSLRTFGVMRQISRVISTTNGDALQLPSVSSHGTASWTAENAAFSASDEAFGTATLNAYKAATLIKVSEELLQDSAFDLEAFISDQFGQRIGVLENTAYVVGDGSAKPTGVTTQATAGVTAAGAAAITADELIDLFHSLSPPYRRNAVFVLNDSTIKLLRKLKDTTNQYLWQPGLQAGQADTLLGKPVYADPDMPAATTGLVSALFGDFSYYWIRDVNGIALQRLNELYAENGQVGFRAYHRTDGKLTQTAAVKKLTQA